MNRLSNQNLCHPSKKCLMPSNLQLKIYLHLEILVTIYIHRILLTNFHNIDRKLNTIHKNHGYQKWNLETNKIGRIETSQVKINQNHGYLIENYLGKMLTLIINQLLNMNQFLNLNHKKKKNLLKTNQQRNKRRTKPKLCCIRLWKQ